jgi:hypothetical protein
MAYAEPDPDAMIRTTFVLTVVGAIAFAVAAALVIMW